MLNETYFVVDNQVLGANLKKSHLHKEGRILGEKFITLRKLVSDVLSPVVVPATQRLDTLKATRALYDCLGLMIEGATDHILFPCLEHPSFRFDLYDAIEQIRLSGVEPGRLAGILATDKWQALGDLLGGYQARLDAGNQHDYAGQLMALMANPLDCQRALEPAKVIVDKSLLLSPLEQQFVSFLGSIVTVEVIDVAGQILGSQGKSPEVVAKAYPNVATETAMALAGILSQDGNLDRAVIAAADYVQTASSVRRTLRQWNLDIPVNFVGGLPVTASALTSLLFRLLDFHQASNMPGYLTSLVMHPCFKCEDSSLLMFSRADILAEFPGYLDLGSLEILLDGYETDDERKRAAVDELLVMIDLFKPLDTDNPRTFISRVAHIFDKCARGKGDEWQIVKAALQEGVERFLEEEYSYVADRNREVVVRSLIKSLGGLQYHLPAVPGALRVVPLAQALGMRIDRLYATGLSVKAFPFKTSQNSIIPDAEMMAINDDLGVAAFITASERTTARRSDIELLRMAGMAQVNASYVFGDKLTAPSEFLQPNGQDGNESLDDFLRSIGATADLGELARQLNELLPVDLFKRQTQSDEKARVDRINAVLVDRAGGVRQGAYSGLVGAFPEDGCFSATGLSGLMQCPFGFYLKKVLKISPFKLPGDHAGTSWLDVLTRGSLYHEILELYQNGLRGGSRPGRKTLDAIIHNVLGEHKARTMPKEKVFEQELASAKRVLGNVIDREAEMLKSARSANEMVEATFGLPDRQSDHVLSLDPVEVTLPSGRIVRLCGSIDRVDRCLEGVRLIDYKTGKNKLKKLEPEAWIADGSYLQHVFYGLAYETVMGSKKTGKAEVGFYFISDKEDYRLVMCEYDKVKAGFIKMLDDLFARLAPGDYFQTFGNCDYCDYRPICHGSSSMPRTDKAFVDFVDAVAMKESK